MSLSIVGCDQWAGTERLDSFCLGLVLLEIRNLPQLADHLFTHREATRARELGSKRRQTFTAARVALKRLAHELGLIEGNGPDGSIETLDADGVRPCLSTSGLHCSVSHDDKFAVAVAGVRPIGVDIERISEKVIKGWHIFMSPQEQGLISRTHLNAKQTATRAWTMKEAASKALGLDLVQAFREVEAVLIGAEESVMMYQEREIPVVHLEADDHVISLVTLNDA